MTLPADFDPTSMQARASEAADLLKALGNPQRLRLLCLLVGKEMAVGQLNEQLPELSQSALSQHLARLRDRGPGAYPARIADHLVFAGGRPGPERDRHAVRHLLRARAGWPAVRTAGGRCLRPPPKHDRRSCMTEFHFVPNQCRPENRLFCGGQPTAQQLADFAREGGGCVVNLRPEAEMGGWDEGAAVRGLGMHYVHIPVAGPEDLSRAGRVDPGRRHARIRRGPPHGALRQWPARGCPGGAEGGLDRRPVRRPGHRGRSSRPACSGWSRWCAASSAG